MPLAEHSEITCPGKTCCSLFELERRRNMLTHSMLSDPPCWISVLHECLVRSPGISPPRWNFIMSVRGGTGLSYGLRETSEDASKLTARRVLGPTPNTLGRHVLTAMPTNRPFRTLEC